MATAQRRSRVFGACLLVLAAGAWPGLAWLYQGGSSHDPVFVGLVLATTAVLMAWGVAAITLGSRPLAAKLHLGGIALLFVAPVLAELGLRASFWFESSPTRVPALYADAFSDEDYWKLHLRWIGKWQPTVNRVHPLLGWSQAPVTRDNPLGLAPATRARMVKDGRRKIVFYGDSFVDGAAPPPDHIPNYMDRQLDTADVIHAGVGGYGTDQTYLLFRETVDLLERPVIVMGIMTLDLDRALLSVRTGRKPLLVADGDGDELKVTGTPIPADQKDFFAHAPLTSRSYVISLFITVVRRLARDALDPRRGEKESLNARIIARTKALCDARQLPLLYVLFYPRRAMGHTGWREAFIKRELDRLKIPFVDTKPVLEKLCADSGAAIEELYLDDHHTAAANRAIGDAVLARLRTLGG